MTNSLYIPLKNRSPLAIHGKDSVAFLQGLLTNNVMKVSDQQAIYALMLTPQGKYLYDFFIMQKGDRLLLDCSAEHKNAIIQKLTMYKLRSDVTIEDISDTYEVVALIGDSVFEKFYIDKPGVARVFCKGVAYIDPRSSAPLARAILEKENRYQSFIAHDFAEGTYEDYEKARIEALIPSGDSDLESGSSFPLDYGMNELSAIDYKKGCYVGQEVTARVHHRGTLRKKIYRVEAQDGTTLPASGTDITAKDGSVIGQLRSSCGAIGLALLKNEELEKADNTAMIGQRVLSLHY